MNADQMMKRIDALWAGISYERWNRGRLYPEEEVQMQEHLDRMGSTEYNLIVELSTGGVTNVAAMVDKHQPEVVLVDGGYLMTDDEEDDDWKGIMRVWRGFKTISLQKKVPFIVTSQLKEGDKVSLSKISFARALANECDGVIALEQDEQMKEDKEIKWKPLKLRDAEMSGYFLTKWDFNNMNYNPIFAGGKVVPPSQQDERPSAIMTEDD